MTTQKFLTLTFVLLITTAIAFGQKKTDDRNNVGKIVDLYLQIKNALVNDDGVTAREKANELHYLMVTQPDKGMNARQARVLGDYLGPLVENIRGISITSYENEQRPYFAGLSLSLYELLKGLHMSAPKLYLQYCPLNKSYWLSETQEIKSPYYNFKEFASVGKTAEVLAAN
jgi:hypothetical protein